MSRFERSRDPDIDVVFVGSLNDRRRKILFDLEARGVQVVECVMNGREERDALLARAKCSINMLYYENGCYPMLRAAHLLSNDVPYVMELAPEVGQDPGVTRVVGYGELVDSVLLALRECCWMEWGWGTTFRQRYKMVLP